MKQKYVTQVDISGGQIKLYPYEGSLEEMNKERHTMGLNPIEEYLKTIRKLYRK